MLTYNPHKQCELIIAHQLDNGTICDTIKRMGKIEKTLTKMRNNPRDWRIEDLKSLADRYGVEYRQPGSSHVTFRAANREKLTVPAHKPIKPIYIKMFIELIDSIDGGDS